jgi:hypothetical protein
MLQGLRGTEQPPNVLVLADRGAAQCEHALARDALPNGVRAQAHVLRERVELVGSHGRWKRPCLQTAHMTI